MKWIEKFFNKYALCMLLIFAGTFLLHMLFSYKINNDISDFLMGIENKTFDTRENITVNSRHVNKDFLILELDDSTNDFIEETFNTNRLPRYVYADVVNFLEQQNPRAIVFDLLFVKTAPDEFNSDVKLAEVFKKYDNIYTSFNFDDIDPELRKPQNLPQKFEANVDNKTKINFLSLPNYRPLSPNLTEVTDKIGHINMSRDKDGVIRSIYPFVTYKDKYYPSLPLIVGQYLTNTSTKNYVVENNKLIYGNNSIPITPNGEIILNWYGQNGVFKGEPLWKVIKASEQTKNGIAVDKEYKALFKDKIIYIGPTSPLLFDIKTVPTDQFFPGVGIHTTFINNMLDNNFVHRVPRRCDFAITFLLSLLVGFSILKIDSLKIDYRNITLVNIFILFGTLGLYYFISLYALSKYNLWLGVVMPFVGVILTFIIIYVVKYFLKSKDYEYTYRLATTDGLTELYNHRYFQEQMISNVETSKRYGTTFSLILTDIDFFKKFNDQYGHQAGDAVLRQVAKTLKKNVRNIDLVCRYGGEEMSIILPNTDNKNAIFVAQKLCDAVANTIFKLSSTLDSHVTISLGVSTYPENGLTPTDLIEYADKGLYIAKENGRNQVGVVKN